MRLIRNIDPIFSQKSIYLMPKKRLRLSLNRGRSSITGCSRHPQSAVGAPKATISGVRTTSSLPSCVI
jgi:hypothetical protein